MSAWSNRAPVWCELVCDACASTAPGRWIKTDRIPRGAMIKDAARRGWLFKGQAMWCSEKCKEQQEKELKHDESKSNSS